MAQLIQLIRMDQAHIFIPHSLLSPVTVSAAGPFSVKKPKSADTLDKRRIKLYNKEKCPKGGSEIKKLFCIFLAAAAILSCPFPKAEAVSISLLGEDEVTVLCGERFIDEGCQAFDNNGHDISDEVRISGEVCLWKPGEYELTYSITNRSRERRSCTRKVWVVAKELPETEETEKTIYLTFDDGPGKYTAELLSLLDSYDAKATFFVIGEQLERNSRLLNKILASGHAVGIHCYHHDYKKLYSSERSFAEDILKTKELIYDLSEYSANLVRFPGGSDTAAAYAEHKVDGGVGKLCGILENMGMRYYDWDESADPKNGGGTYSVKRLEKLVKTVECPVVIQHDTRRSCLDATREILEWGAQNGYSFKALDLTVPSSAGE